MFGEDAGAGLLLLLLITIACVAAVVHFIRIPYSVAHVLAALALALLPGTPRLAVTPEIILVLFLPILLFYGAYHLNVRDLRVTLKPVTPWPCRESSPPLGWWGWRCISTQGSPGRAHCSLARS